MNSAASLLAVIAYHDKVSDAQQFRHALQAWDLRDRMDSDPNWGWRPRTIVPELLRPQPEWVERTVDRGIQIIVTRRLLAAEIAGELFAKNAFDELSVALCRPIVIKGAHGGEITGKDAADAHAARLLADLRGRRRGRATLHQESKSARGNIKTRTWKDSLPVLHLTSALRGFVQEQYPDSDSLPTLEIMRVLPVARIVQLAALLAPEIAAKFNVSNQTSVAIR